MHIDSVSAKSDQKRGVVNCLFGILLSALFFQSFPSPPIPFVFKQAPFPYDSNE